MPRLASTAGAGLSLRQLQPKQSVSLPKRILRAFVARHKRGLARPAPMPRLASTAGAGFSSCKLQPKQSISPPIRILRTPRMRQVRIKAGWPALMQVTAYSKRITPHRNRRPIECTTPHRKLRRHMARQAEPAPFSALTGGAVLMPVTACTKRTTSHRSACSL